VIHVVGIRPDDAYPSDGIAILARTTYPAFFLECYGSLERVPKHEQAPESTLRCGPHELTTMITATHAGAITAKLDSGTIGILLVTAKRNCAQWIFPKGHIEPGESAESAALRELREEAGIAGKSLGLLGRLAFGTDEGEVVDYYLVQFVAEQGKGESERQVQWFRFDEAIDRLSFPDAKKLLSDLRLTIEERLKKSQPG